VSRRSESGYALLGATMVLFLLSIALGLLGASLQLRLRLVRQDGENVILSALSDAAVAEAVANLTRSASYSGSPEHEFGAGRIASRVLPLGAGIFDVTATASFAARKRVVEAEVLCPPGSAARVRRWRRLPG
jgi:hypothetical protein